MSVEKTIGHTEMNTLPRIVAIDFDGTLVEDAFPEIGPKNEEMFDLCKKLKTAGVKLILWTSRANDSPARNLDTAVAYCIKQGIEFDAVNENLPEVQKMFGGDTRKVYADLYIDDKSVVAGTAPHIWAHRLGLNYSFTVHEGKVGWGFFNAT